MKKMEIVVVIVEAVIAVALIMGILSLFTPTPVTRITSPFTPTPGYYPDLHVSMTYAHGWNTGAYGLEIDGNGDVNYSEGHQLGGGRWTQEQRSGKLSPQQIEELATAIKRVQAWATWAAKHPSLAGILCPNCPMMDLSITLNGQTEHHFVKGLVCMDCPTIGLSITLNGQTEHISHSMLYWDCRSPGSPPKELCDLENQIAAIRYLDIYPLQHLPSHPLWSFLRLRHPLRRVAAGQHPRLEVDGPLQLVQLRHERRVGAAQAIGHRPVPADILGLIRMDFACSELYNEVIVLTTDQ